MSDVSYRPCVTCDGTGELEEQTTYRDEAMMLHLEGTDRFYKCPDCDGTGEIETEIE